MTNRYEVKGTDEFFLHIQDNEEWPEDKAEGYIGNIWRTVDILNKQDQQIKELKQYNKHLQEQNINLLMRLEKLEQRK